jgi:hypothetical protein
LRVPEHRIPTAQQNSYRKPVKAAPFTGLLLLAWIKIQLTLATCNKCRNCPEKPGNSWIEESLMDDGFLIALTVSLLAAAVTSTGIYTIRRFGVWELE